MPKTFIQKHPIEYKAFHDAKNRCTNPHNKDHKDYLDRGIKFLFTSFEQFFREIGSKPRAELTLERINNDGNYEIGNVKWATRKEQANNQRKNVFTPEGLKVMQEHGRELGRKNVESGHISRLGKSGIGGRIGGLKANDTEHRINPNYTLSRMKGGRKNVESGHIATLGRKYGAINGWHGGRTNAESGQMAALGRSGIGNHTRHHINKGVVIPDCKFCRVALKLAA